MKKISTLAGILIILVAAIILFGGVFAYGYFATKTQPVISYSNIQKKNRTSSVSVTGNTVDLKITGEYVISFSYSNCGDYFCTGPGLVTIKNFNTKNIIQTIKSNLYFSTLYLKDTSQENGPIFLEDFNFDGIKDLGISTTGSGYGSYAYDVYIFDPVKKQFVLNQKFTNTIGQNNGGYSIDKTKKIITTYNKSGCCWHQTLEYQVVNNEPQLFHKLTEDFLIGDMGTVTDEKLIDGKWVTTTKQISAKVYYGN